MKCYAGGLVRAGLLAAVLPAVGLATDGRQDEGAQGAGALSQGFERIATFPSYRNGEDHSVKTVSGTLAATVDGRTLVYTDSARGAIGVVDISDASEPRPAGAIQLDPDQQDETRYEPTSVDVLGNNFALVAVDTSRSPGAPSGVLAVVDLRTGGVLGEKDLGGQPGALKISPDGRYVAVAIENERDEDVVVDGVTGGLPQSPAGYLAILEIANPSRPDLWHLRPVDLTGLAAYGADDPEPELVDINAEGQAAVTLQENNHAVVVDLEDGSILSDFPLGTVTLEGVDATEDGVISLTETLAGVPREPAGVAWLPAGDRGQRGQQGGDLAFANEGDLFGGSRGFSIFEPSGEILYDSGTELEELAVARGHYPEGRSEDRGIEPEALEHGRFGDTEYLFVGAERGGFVAVYELAGPSRTPRLRQLLAAPLGPEGLLAIPSRGLLAVSGDVDAPELGVRSSIMIYQFRQAPAGDAQIVSGDVGGEPLPWSALSGMTSVPGNDAVLLAVCDAHCSESRVFTIDVSKAPARVVGALAVWGGGGDYDPEGIAVAPDGTLWIASEGDPSDQRPNRLLQLDADGQVLREIGLPDAILRCRAAESRKRREQQDDAYAATLGAGFQGVAILPAGREGGVGGYRLLVAQQRGWDYTTDDECEALDDDAGGLDANGQPRRTRLWIYDPSIEDLSEAWAFVAWELAEAPEGASWVGLSEITRAPGDSYVVIERDDRSGPFAELKHLVALPTAAAADGLVEDAEKAVHDLIPALAASNGWITGKPEGVAITGAAETYLVSDNDGVENWSGETWLLRLGDYRELFSD